MKRCPQCQAACWDAHRHCPACGADVSDVPELDGDPLIGLTVGGKFVLRDLLAEGAMGKVYRADQTNLGRTVAVKVMNPVLAADEGLVRRFHDEARSASRLNHPHIVSVIDFGQSETGILYIVMEYLRGRTLARLIAEEAPLTAERIVNIMGQVLDALDEAHSQGIVHRDLKPDNIMVEVLRTGGDFAKVLDFGIAKLRREDRDFETIDGQCGTPEYMAPEQVRGQDDVDGRADLYSLGIVMYEMLTALTPFAGGSHAEVFAKQLNYAAKPPREARPDIAISAAMEAIVLKLLEKRREDRFGNAAAFKQALELALEERTGPKPLEKTGAIEAEGSAIGPAGGGAFPLPALPRPEWNRLSELLGTGPTRGLGIALSGPDGAGKSSLIAYSHRLAERTGRVCYRVAPDPTGARRAWHPLRVLCSEILGLSGKVTLDLIDGAIQKLHLDALDIVGIAELFGVSGDFSALEHDARRRECMASVLRVLRGAASERPAFFVFNDIDRYDQPSREVVHRLLEAAGPGDLVVLATGPRTAFPAGADPRFALIDLAPFGSEEVDNLIGHVFGSADAELREHIVQASGGLPLHVEQSLRYMAEGGPEPHASLADTIGARIALLPLEARTVLQAVAVSGGEADESLLASVGLDTLAEPLALLVERGFAVAGSGRIRIVHPLFTDVAYEGIPEEARRGLHARFWSALEGRHQEPAVLGRHAYETRERRAVVLLERAGERSQRQFDDAGASVHYRRAVELQRWALMEGVPEAEEGFVRLSVRLGEALRYTSDLVGAEGVLREALGFTQGNAALEARVRLALGRLAVGWGQLDRAERDLRGALRIAFKVGDPALLAELYLEFGGLCILRGDLEAGIDELSEGVNLCTGGEGAESEVGPDVLWRLVARQAETLQQAGDAPAALAVAKHALRHARRVRSLVGEARVNALLGQLYEAAQEPKLAADHRTHALQLMRRLGDRRSTAELLIADAANMLKRGGVRRDTLMRLQEASQLAAQVGWQEGVDRSQEVIRETSAPVKTSAEPRASR